MLTTSMVLPAVAATTMMIVMDIRFLHTLHCCAPSCVGQLTSPSSRKYQRDAVKARQSLQQRDCLRGHPTGTKAMKVQAMFQTCGISRWKAHPVSGMCATKQIHIMVYNSSPRDARACRAWTCANSPVGISHACVGPRAPLPAHAPETPRRFSCRPIPQLDPHPAQIIRQAAFIDFGGGAHRPLHADGWYGWFVRDPSQCPSSTCRKVG